MSATRLQAVFLRFLCLFAAASTAVFRMKAALQLRAAELGFDACRVTSAAPPESAHHLASWLAAGNHGAMNWLERNAARRSDPQQVLPGVRSIVTLAASYHQGEQPDVAGGRPIGIVARYARYRDYHDVLGERLKTLAAFLDRLGGQGTRSLWYVDTGPVLERDLAQRAGLGFIGKHTNVISRSLGNWFFLAEILTTLELPPDEPERNRCGSCARCIEACPTRAITAPFVLDARRCISYLTIELKGSIPVEFRPAIGNRIFGCDDCLAVCPWNKFAQEAREMSLRAREELRAPGLAELAGLDDAAFRARFRKSPVKRIGRDRFLRNVLTAIGNSNTPHLAQSAKNLLADESPLVRGAAVWALSRLLPPDQLRALRNDDEADANVRAEWDAAIP